MWLSPLSMMDPTATPPPGDSRPSAAVLTSSDRCSAGEAPDRSGALARSLLETDGFRVEATAVVPDEVEDIRERVRAWAGQGVRLIVTTGGTGLGPRDVTPEAVTPLLDRELPGYGELLRADGLRDTPMAVLSRSLAGSIGATLVVVLPGSPRAVESGLKTLRPTLSHALDLLAGNTAHGLPGEGCGRRER